MTVFTNKLSTGCMKEFRCGKRSICLGQFHVDHFHLQNLNLAVQGEQYQDYLQDRRRQSLDMVVEFDHLSEVAILSGGTSSFEWPQECQGWKESEILSMISRFNMFSCYPTGCGFDLTIQGKTPRKEWRIVTTSQRLAFELQQIPV